jgi:S-adenosylmethionine decarboxylase
MMQLAREQLVPAGHADASEMCSYAIDVWVKDARVLTDGPALLEIMRGAAEAGHAIVLSSSSHQFPNGAITAVLILSQSHLSVHTWPEYGSASFDLLTCGRLNGELMIGELRARLSPVRANISRTIRDVTIT